MYEARRPRRPAAARRPVLIGPRRLARCRAARRTGGPARRRGPKPTPTDPRVKQIATLERQLALANARAERLARIVDLQKKVSQLLGLALPASFRSSRTSASTSSICVNVSSRASRRALQASTNWSAPRLVIRWVASGGARCRSGGELDMVSANMMRAVPI